MRFRAVVFGAVLVATTFSASAVDVSALAARSGLTERQVRMVLGAPTSFVEYRTSYWRATRQLRAIVGSERALRELAEEFRIDEEYEFEVLVDGVPVKEAKRRAPDRRDGDRPASLSFD